MNKSQLLKQVEWQDLRQLTAWQLIYNIILPYPFLWLSWGAISQSWYLVAMICSYLFVVTAYRQGHDLFHNALGVHRYVSTVLMFVISVLSFSSLHSMKYSHLLHHREPLGEHDTEGYLAKDSWYRALFGGLLFRCRLFVHGFALAPRHQKTKIIIETLFIISLAVVTFYTQAQILLYQFAVMFVMNAFAGLIAVWGLHHDCDDNDIINAGTERNRLVNAMSFNLFYHAEHHLFPAVPTHNLPKLAKRLDKVAPQIAQNKVVDFSTGNKDEACPIRKRFA